MNNASIVSELSISPDAQRRTTLILDRISQGSETPFYSPYASDEKEADDMLSGWDKIFNDKQSKINDTLKVLEVDTNRPKFGPMSYADNWVGRRETMYDSYKTARYNKSFAPYVLGPVNRLRPLSVQKAIGYLKNDSNAGFPDVTKKKTVKDRYLGYTLDDFANIISNYIYKGVRTVEIACILFTRTQELGKTRNVWGYSIIATIYEMCFYRPVLDIQSKQPWRSALRRPVDVATAVTKIIDYAILNKLEILSIDFKRFDNSVKRHLIIPAFETVSAMFQKQYESGINLMRDFFISCPIVTPDGRLTGDHGVPSGSTFTNEIDSIVQYGVARECSAIVRIDLCQVQGDDGVYLCNVAKNAVLHFPKYDLDVSEAKSYVAQNWCIFLQSLFHTDYRDEDGIIHGIYPTYRALNRIIHLERFEDFSDYDIKGSDYFSIRTISILENCKYHPLFEEFVTYVWSRDKYSLVYSDQGLANYVRKLAIQEGKDITFRNWSYGSDVSGLKTFASVQIINRLNSKYGLSV